MGDVVDFATVENFNNCSATTFNADRTFSFKVENGNLMFSSKSQMRQERPLHKVDDESWKYFLDSFYPTNKNVVWQHGDRQTKEWTTLSASISLMLELLYIARNKIVFEPVGFVINNFVPKKILKYSFEDKFEVKYEVTINLEEATHVIKNTCNDKFIMTTLQRIIV